MLDFSWQLGSLEFEDELQRSLNDQCRTDISSVFSKTFYYGTYYDIMYLKLFFV